MRLSMQITVEQAKAVNAFVLDAWTLCQTPEGWLAMLGDSTLIGMNAQRPRIFASVDTAIRRLGAVVGVHDFKAEARAI